MSSDGEFERHSADSDSWILLESDVVSEPEFLKSPSGRSRSGSHCESPPSTGGLRSKTGSVEDKSRFTAVSVQDTSKDDDLIHNTASLILNSASLPWEPLEPLHLSPVASILQSSAFSPLDLMSPPSTQAASSPSGIQWTLPPLSSFPRSSYVEIKRHSHETEQIAFNSRKSGSPRNTSSKSSPQSKTLERKSLFDIAPNLSPDRPAIAKTKPISLSLSPQPIPKSVTDNFYNIR